MTTATKQGHTVGPWHRNIRREGRYPVVFAGRNQHVATASQQDDPAETEANIDLISAAPELLEALNVIARASERSEKLFGGSMSEVTRVFENITRVARAAIARATGQGGAK